MTQIEKDNIIRRTRFRHLSRRFYAGIKAIRNNATTCYLFILYLLVMAAIWKFRGAIFGLNNTGPFVQAADGLMRLALPLCFAVGLLIVLLILGTPPGSATVREALLKVGLANHAGEAPVLISKQQNQQNPQLTIWEFDPCGISLSEWEDRKEGIEAALNITIAKMKWVEGHKTICVYAVPAINDYPALLHWKEEYLSPDSFVLTLGKSLVGPVTVNVVYAPHVLLGGSTGSGKSVLLKLLLMQAANKGAEVYIADFKGGVDFPPIWHKRCHMCFSEDVTLYTLTRLVGEIEYRKKLLAESGYPNIDEYTTATKEPLPRLIFACDEVAELLDKTGRRKEDKENLAQIESKLATIARLGRAFGVHLILATQRPDATIIPGQIKNNIDFRVCGRADNVLSQIVLDNTSAADQIPKDARGRFITGDGTVFQAYWFDDSTW